MEARQVVRLVGFLDPDCPVDDASARAALTLFEVLLSPVGEEAIRAGFWVGTINSAPSALSERVRDHDGRVVSGYSTENFIGFDLTMMDLETDASALTELLRVRLDGFTDLIEWPDYLEVRSTKSVLWKVPGGSALVMSVPESVATSLMTSELFRVEVLNATNPEYGPFRQGLG